MVLPRLNGFNNFDQIEVIRAVSYMMIKYM